MTLTVRPFSPDEAPVLGAVRMEALANTPDAFAEHVQVAMAAGGEDFSARLSRGEIWGAFLDGACVGMAGLEPYVGANVRHKATVWGVYVGPAARGRGAGQALFEAIIDHARAVGVEVLQLGVGDFNAPAQRLYRRMGFEPYGLERRALKLEGRYIDEVLMALYL